MVYISLKQIVENEHIKYYVGSFYARIDLF